MSKLKLTIDLLPKGAWGNNLSKTLPKKDWDTLRHICYERAGNRCCICDKEDSRLDAHEVWEFDMRTKTQTLKDIMALCPACHGVKHMRNSERIGYRR
jgi:5-methylcytosine-specific restriction endonuclease McrA